MDTRTGEVIAFSGADKLPGTYHRLDEIAADFREVESLNAADLGLPTDEHAVRERLLEAVKDGRMVEVAPKVAQAQILGQRELRRRAARKASKHARKRNRPA